MTLAEHESVEPRRGGLPGAPGSAWVPDRERAGRARPPIPQRGLPESYQPLAVRSPRPLLEAIRYRGHPGVPPAAALCPEVQMFRKAG